jgi:hypothetical protein
MNAPDLFAAQGQPVIAVAPEELDQLAQQFIGYAAAIDLEMCSAEADLEYLAMAHHLAVEGQVVAKSMADWLRLYLSRRRVPRAQAA